MIMCGPTVSGQRRPELILLLLRVIGVPHCAQGASPLALLLAAYSGAVLIFGTSPEGRPRIAAPLALLLRCDAAAL